MQEVVGFLITSLLQIYQEIFQWNNLAYQLRFDGIVARSLQVASLFWPTLYFTLTTILVD